MIRDEDRPTVRAISLQRWAGQFWSGQWEHQMYLAVPTARGGKGTRPMRLRKSRKKKWYPSPKSPKTPTIRRNPRNPKRNEPWGHSAHRAEVTTRATASF